ncbi:MAG: NUDIX hydrolase [Cyclobacteriaceae bacterium]|nr:NUDIX hydrolase [Cyclobacteriaceae bacterium]
MTQDIAEKFGNRLRLRVCGLCWDDDRLLMVNHQGLHAHNFWSPPGGGVEYGQSVTDVLIREIAEETGLTVQVAHLQFVCEYVHHPLHAVELFFFTRKTGGLLVKGSDPEMEAGTQIISEVTFLSWPEIQAIPAAEKHGIFSFCRKADDLKKLTGFFRI